VIYIIHFAQKLHHAQHYVGTCRDDRLSARLQEHASGQGASLTRAVAQRGIDMWLARTLPDMSYEQERRIKAAGHIKHLCPLCCPMFEHLKSQATLINPQRPTSVPARAVWDVRGPLTFPDQDPKKKGPA
jgi:predicted GIY-YIG superfamily endonuclease